MNDQDRDLIASLAEGFLDGQAAVDALSRIEADPELASEYAAQTAALAFLGSAPVPQMTAAERTQLRADLAEQLGLAVDEPVTLPARTKMPWWQPVFGLAAAAAVVAAVVVVPGMISSSDEATFEAIAGDRGEVDTSELQAEAVAPTVTHSTTEATGEGDDGAAGMDAPESTLLDADLSVYQTNAVTLDELLSQTKGAEGPDDIEERLSTLGFSSRIELPNDQVGVCLEQLAADFPDGIARIHVLGAEIKDESTIVSIGFDFGSGVENALSFELENCSIVSFGPQG